MTFIIPFTVTAVFVPFCGQPSDHPGTSHKGNPEDNRLNCTSTETCEHSFPLRVVFTEQFLKNVIGTVGAE